MASFSLPEIFRILLPLHDKWLLITSKDLSLLYEKFIGNYFLSQIPNITMIFSSILCAYLSFSPQKFGNVLTLNYQVVFTWH